MDLELATTAELIRELTKRETFVGLVLFSQQEQKVSGQYHDNFAMHTTLNGECTTKLLEIALSYISKDK